MIRDAIRLNWKVTLFSLFFFVLFVCLGSWQLQRETEKVELIQAREQRTGSPAVGLTALNALTSDVDGVRIHARGDFDRQQVFLLDNRVLEGKVGFEVLAVFRGENSDMAVLVNRGFVPMNRTRNVVPAIPWPASGGTLSIEGVVYAGDYQQLSSALFSRELPGAMIVQTADPLEIGRLAGVTLYPHLVRLAETSVGALPRHWPVTTMQPEKHRAYAVQWFAMAVAVLGALIAFTWHKRGETADE